MKKAKLYGLAAIHIMLMCSLMVFNACKTDVDNPGPQEKPPDTPSVTEYSITVTQPDAGGTISADKTAAEAGTLITVTAEPQGEYYLSRVQVTRTGGGNVSVQNTTDPNVKTFTMPPIAVTVTAAFNLPDAPKFAITVDPVPVNGRVEIDPEEAAENDTVTITAIADNEYRLGSFTVKTALGEDVALDPAEGASNVRTFQMPAENVNVTASFISTAAPTFAVDIDSELENGSITSDKALASEDETVTLTIFAFGGYCLSGEPVVTGASGTVPVNAGENETWTFTMPGEAVTVTALFSPVTYSIVIDSELENGGIQSNVSSAKEGDTVSLSIIPNLDFTLKGSPSVTGDVSGNAVAVNGSNETWTFAMPGEPVFITAEFESAFVQKYDIIITSYAKGKITANLAEASEGTSVTLTVETIAGYDLESGSLKVNGSVDPVRVGLTSQYTFAMPADDALITASFASPSQVYLIYSNGVLNAENPQLFSGSGGPAPSGTVFAANEGRGFNSSAFTIAPSSGAWFGFHIDRSSGPQIDLNTVDALSFWIRSPDGPIVIEKIGFGTGGGILGESQQVEIQDIEVSSQWKRVLIPVPERKTGNLTPANYFYLSTNNGPIGKTMYIDDMEFITATRTVKQITLPVPNVNLSIAPPPATATAISLIGKATVTYTVDGTDIALTDYFDDYNDVNLLPNWHTYNYAVTGQASVAGGVITPTQANSSFTLALRIGSVTSNAITVTILAKQAVRTVIDNFDPENAINYFYTHGGGTGQLNSTHGRPSAQLSATASVLGEMRRINQSHDLTGLEKVTFSVYVTSNAVPGGNPNPPFVYRLGLIVGGNIMYYAPEFRVFEDELGSWQDFEINMSDFVNAGIPISSLSDIVITGWILQEAGPASNTSNIWISEIVADFGTAASRPSRLFVTVKVEADFSGFPATITLSKSQNDTLNISLDKFDTAQWYVNGRLRDTGGAFELTTADLEVRDHSLTVVVTLNGHRYSKTVSFKVTE